MDFICYYLIIGTILGIFSVLLIPSGITENTPTEQRRRVRNYIIRTFVSLLLIWPIELPILLYYWCVVFYVNNFKN